MLGPEFFSPHEHKLFGSTVDKTHEKNPYIPIGVQRGEFSVEDCNSERLHNPVIGVLSGYFGVKGTFGKARISPLNTDIRLSNYGQSICDPVLIETDNFDYHSDDSSRIKWRDGPKIEIKLSDK